MTSSPDDKTLEEYLDRDSAVSQHYRKLDADDVPASVDASVLAQARAAVAPAREVRKSKPAWVRWGSPLALAASAVMVVAIVLEVGVQDEVQLPVSITEQSAPAAGRAQSTTPAENEQRDLQAPLAVTAPAPASPRAPAAEPAPEQKAAAMADSVPLAETQQFAVVPAPADPLDTDRRESTVAAPPAPVAQKSVAPRRETVETVASTAPPAAPIESDRREQEQITTAAARERVDRERAEQIIVSGNVVTPAARRPFGPRATGAPSSSQPREVRDDDRIRAEEWLDEIRRLRDEGKEAQADEQWQRFRKQFPDFVVERTDTALPASQREAAP